MHIKIYFLNGNEDPIQQHYFQKEYRDDVVIEYDGGFYEVYFFTESSLKYVMRSDGFFSFPGLIVLEDICNEKIINSIQELCKLEYFTFLAGRKEMPINNRFIQKWFTNDLNSFDTKSIATIILEIKGR